jgi:HD-GYP domain-containing protein (c-di-GMP phosphodiesterase class II)
LDAVDRFVRIIQEGPRVPDQTHAALTAMREGTGAALAFLYSSQTGRAVEMAGEPLPTARWCGELTRRLAADLPLGGLWSASEPASSPVCDETPEPTHAALVPVEDPKPGWLVLVTFPGQPSLPTSAPRLMSLVWRLQAGHSRNALLFDNLKETLFRVVRCLSTAIDAKDPFTAGHSERVARIAVRLGEEMGLGRDEISDLYLAGLLHDVGKIGIRDGVLLKEGPLTDAEFAHIKEHPVLGERIIANVSRLAYLRPGVRGHHERFDGMGYPDRIASEAIPLMARILAVADSCDAMMSARRYRAALPSARIEQIMREGSGTQWDPRIIEHFFACRHELYAVCQRGLGQSVYMAVERAVGSDVSHHAGTTGLALPR